MTGSNPFPAQVPPEDLARRLDEAEPPLLVDVREPDEFAQAHIPGCVLMPLNTLGARVGELPKDREVVVVCLSGARSAMATQFLRQSGYQAANLAGGLRAWRGPLER
jgi:rhodanese-related sulfurtransferase